MDDRRSMPALVFRYSLPRLAFARVLGVATSRAYVSLAGPTRLERVPEPRLLGDDWTVVRTALCGICGSDLKQVFLNARRIRALDRSGARLYGRGKPAGPVADSGVEGSTCPANRRIATSMASENPP